MSISMSNAPFYFYPRPPRGGRRSSPSRIPVQNNFYPRPPRGGRPTSPATRTSDSSDFYPRPPRGGRPAPLLFYHISLSISIHALREEGDVWQSHPASAWSNFYPRPPRGGRRHRTGSGSQSSRFLSTPSARRATVVCARFELLDDDFYPRPPRGGRLHQIHRAVTEQADISIHALREEGDESGSDGGSQGRYFYPRPPRGGRQQKQRQNLYFQTNYTTFCTNLEEP